MVPIKMFFDGEPNVQGSDFVRLPKLYEGSPYTFSFRIRNEDDTYVNFELYTEIRMRIKLRPADNEVLMELKRSTGHFSVSTETETGDTLTISINASDWNNVALPRSVNYKQTDVPFTYVIEVLDVGGNVTERFAHGTGFISSDLGAE